MKLANEKCQPCRDGSGTLGEAEVTQLLASVNGWQVEQAVLSKRYKFKNFAQALAFVNHIGVIAEAQDHHPDLEFGWGYVIVKLTTHSVKGLTRNDFIVAAKIDAL